MSTKHPSAENGTANGLPGDWVKADDNYDEIAAFEHDGTGQRVSIRRDRRPTQMHDALTSADDTGFVTRVEDPDGRSAQLSPDLSAESVARQTARQFMAAYDGDFEIPEPDGFDSGPVEW